jgi:hypothetical protein
VRPDARPLASQIEQSFLRRIGSLPDATQRLMLAAAAEPVGDLPLLMRVAEQLGIGAHAAAPAQAAGLIELDTRVRFRHPLVRSTAYRAASADDRQNVHRALAEATDPESDPDRRAWHLAHPAADLDENVARELEQSAGRAQSRGGVAAAAAFLRRATELTPDPAIRGVRALAAAQATFEAGASDAAQELLTSAELGPLDELQRARLAWLRAKMVFALRRGGRAPALLLAAAERLERHDHGQAREAYLESLGAAVFAGDLDGLVLREVAVLARKAPPPPRPPRLLDVLLDGLAMRFTEGVVAGVPRLRRGPLVGLPIDDEAGLGDGLPRPGRSVPLGEVPGGPGTRVGREVTVGCLAQVEQCEKATDDAVLTPDDEEAFGLLLPPSPGDPRRRLSLLDEVEDRIPVPRPGGLGVLLAPHVPVHRREDPERRQNKNFASKIAYCCSRPRQARKRPLTWARTPRNIRL